MESYKVKPGYVLREIAEEYLAVPVGTGGEIVILTPVSKLLWERMAGAATLDELDRRREPTSTSRPRRGS